MRTFERQVPDWSERLVRDRLFDARVDLRDTRCGSLNDNAAKAWNHTQPAMLEEFKYGGTFVPRTYISRSYDRDETEARLFWLRGIKAQNRRQLYLASLQRVATALGIRWICSQLDKKSDHWWNRPDESFHAQPYTHLARILRERGDDEAARAVEAEKYRLGAFERAKRNVVDLLMLIFWWWPYGLFFRFGLAPVRALITLLVFWFIGFVAIATLSESKMLTANTGMVSVEALPGPDPKLVIPVKQEQQFVDKLPCGDAIHPALYALELMTPSGTCIRRANARLAKGRQIGQRSDAPWTPCSTLPLHAQPRALALPEGYLHHPGESRDFARNSHILRHRPSLGMIE